MTAARSTRSAPARRRVRRNRSWCVRFSQWATTAAASRARTTLRRRTPGNLTVEIFLDVGTWSRSLTGFFSVNGFGFGARLGLPVSKHAIGRLQYPIGDGEHWQQIVDNLAALVAELDRTLVPAIEAVSGPAPAWYSPESRPHD